ncbi:MAG: hypothetical protein PHO66_08940 [Eubacteriales bacterium]|nr:hypothetical protein [Eubacteriales bacterium]
MSRAWYRRALGVLVSAALLLGGCAAPVAPEPLQSYPQVAVSQERVAPPESSQYDGWSVRVVTAAKVPATLADSSLIQVIVDAWATRRLVVADAAGPFANQLEVLDAAGQVRYAFSLASDGKLLLKDDMNRVFQMPAYAYYMLEGSLSAYGLTLKNAPISWSPTAANAQLQLEYYLPHIIKTIQVPALGYAMAYFTDVVIYDMRLENNDTQVKLYLLTTFAGYDLQHNVFSMTIRDIRPANLTLTQQKDGSWLATGYQQAADPRDYESVRAALPYDYAKQAIADVKDPSDILKDIRVQAADYLRQAGLSAYPVEQ